jgi:hypothetical protein
LEHDNAAIDVLLPAAADFLDLHAAPETKPAVTQALMQHERGAGLVLQLSRCRCTWLHDNGDLGLRTQAVLFEILEQHKEYPAVWEGFLQAGAVDFLLKLLGSAFQPYLGWTSQLPRNWYCLNEYGKQRVKKVEQAATVAARLSATAAGRAALATPEMVKCLLHMVRAGEEQRSECLDNVFLDASLVLVRLAADAACKTAIAAQGGLPGFLRALVWWGCSDEQLQERLKERCIARRRAALELYRPSS